MFCGDTILHTDPAAGRTHALSFITHDEGRVIPDPQSGQLVYEYHYRDHLGNLRVSFRQQSQQSTTARLSMEPPLATREEAAFRKVSESRTAGTAHSGRYAARLLQESGPGKTVKLQPGETLKASVFGYVEPSRKRRTAWLPVPILGDEPVVVDGKPSRKLKVKAGIAIPIRSGKKQGEVPDAFLQLIARDTSGKIVSLQTAKLGKAAIGGWQELQLVYQAKTGETVEVSVVNGSDRVSALFDDLTLTQEPPLIVQENHYDPWGLNLAGIETQGQPDHKYQYNGKEKQDEFGLDWSDYGARMYDAQLGRWHMVDPASEEEDQESWSPYHYVHNNPTKNTDPDGRTPITGAIGFVVGGIIGGAIEAGTQLYQHGEVNDWKAVGGSTLQGAITGGVAGLTGGTSLLVMAGANVVGGAANRAVQGKGTTAKDMAMDAAVGVAAGVGGKLLDKGVKALANTPKVTKGSFEIGDGVRRAKASDMLGKKTIKATNSEGKEITVRVKDLKSPHKTEIDVSTPDNQQRFQTVYDGIKKNDEMPPIYVAPGNRGVPIKDVKFKNK